ncbi:MAG: fdm 2 [Bacteriovoracaceae bacterium]|nr:fdm 2 [Bacteriovoracaceae bacterium]
MKAVCWNGKKKVTVESVDEPRLINKEDVVVSITSTAICGSDIHLYDGFVPTMERGDILGHEFMGEVVEKGPSVTKLKIGDRVVVPFVIACGQCYNCKNELYSLCDNSNPHGEKAEIAAGYQTAGIYGYSHMYGGFAGGQAEYARVPFANTGPIVVPTTLTDEQVLFLSDIFPTGYMAAENCDIKPGDIVAVWGCGPVGQLAIKSAFLLGASRVIAIDRFQERLDMVRDNSTAEVLNYDKEDDLVERLKVLTGGRGPDACIDAVGAEAHGHQFDAYYDRLKTAIGIGTDQAHALREAIRACRKGGNISIVGVYVGYPDAVPLGAAFAKGLKFKMGQCNVQKYMPTLLNLIEDGRIDPSFVITHKLNLSDASHAYDIFRNKKEDCVKVVLNPAA